MLKNYLKTAWRSLWKNKLASSVNLVGLVTGLTCCILMITYIRHELHYDKFQVNGDRIVRAIMQYGIGDGTIAKGNFTSTKVLPAFQREFPEIESGVRMEQWNMLVKNGDLVQNESRFLIADSTFFKVFSSFPLLKGDPNQVLNHGNHLVMSASTAKRYFKDEDPIGKTIKIGSSQKEFMIAGVAEDSPVNSQIKFDFIAPFTSLVDVQEESYFNANYTTYFLLKNADSRASLENKVNLFMKKEMAEHPEIKISYEFEPFYDIHLKSPYNGFEPNGNIMHLYFAGGVVVLILLIACFTFINLSTARSLERAKEVGIRKVTGAKPRQIFWQFIGESALLTCLASLISLALSLLFLPFFAELVQRELVYAGILNTFVLLGLIGLAGIISVLAGAYPAIVLATYQSIKVLKGKFQASSPGVRLRQVLFVFQFVVSAFLIIATFVIQNQLSFIQNKKLGYQKDHIISIPTDAKVLESKQRLNNGFKENPSILSLSFAYESPVHILGGYNVYTAENGEHQAQNIYANPIDENYLTTTEIVLIAGSDLQEQDIKNVSHSDSDEDYYQFLLNESAVKLLGWTPEESIGKKIFLGSHRPGEVKGVFRDFHFASLHSPIEPLILFPNSWLSGHLLVRTDGQNVQSTLDFMALKWKELIPHRPFSYQFLDDDFQNLYANEKQISEIMGLFSGITIILACLGLFGLSSYSVQQKRKEIGVRKVLGATVLNIVKLLSGSFIKMVLFGILIAAPFAWWVMNQWLQDFAYRINLDVWIFIVSGSAALTVAILTVCWQAIKAAVANPVESLRDE